MATNTASTEQPEQPEQSSHSLSDTAIERLLAVQEQKIALELKQAEVSLRELDHNQKLADKSIDAQIADRKDERSVAQTMHKHRLIFMGIVITLVISFAVIAIALDKDAIVLDMTKVILGFVGGWGASLAWQRQKQRPPSMPDE